MHGGHEGHFPGFALVAQTLMEGADGGIVADGGQGGHVEDPVHTVVEVLNTKGMT